MSDITIDPEDLDPEEKPTEFVKYWCGQLDSYYNEFKDWEFRCDKILRRYRDERASRPDGYFKGGARFNILWSNINTLSPAIYKKPPKPIVERRYLDKDQLARFSSMTLERALEVQIDQGGLHPSMQKAVLDYLLCGRGTIWERYEPKYGVAEDLGPSVQDEESTDEKEDDGEAPRPVEYEKVCTDYVYWKNFRHGTASIWEEVPWVGKLEMLTREELRTRFKGEYEGKPIADQVPLASLAVNSSNPEYMTSTDKDKIRKEKKAKVWEIWDKTSKKIIFIAPDFPNAPLEVTDDPLHLQTFWPCPKPLYATVTNDSLVPIPDYVEYFDQAEELDNLTARIKALTDSLRVNGVYDASIPELKRILQEGMDNRLIGVAKWSEFSSKGGLKGAIDFIPLKDIADTLLQLYEARDKTKNDLYEITGISDIVRGQASEGGATATEQRIKGQFATLRLQDRQSEVQRFARDSIRIKAEIISEQFSPEILAEMTGMLPFITQEISASMPLPPPPMMGHNGGPPMTSSPAPFPGGGAPQPGAMPGGMQPPDPQQIAQQIFSKCIQLLKNDNIRTFRIDIETDSTIEIDRQAEKEAVTQLFTAVGGYLQQAAQIGQMLPQLVPALGQSLLYAFRVFGAGRDVEGVWEQAIDQLTQQSKNPPPKPPSPEQIKAQSEQQKMQMQGQQMQAQAQLDQQKSQLDLQAQTQKAQIDIQKQQADLEIKKQELALEQQRMAMKAQELQMIYGAKAQEVQLNAAANVHKIVLDAEATERKHEIGLETLQAKAKAVKNNENAS